MASTYWVELTSAGIGPAGNYTFRFTPAFQFDGDWVCSVARYSIWLTIPNVSPDLLTDTVDITIDSGSTWITVTFPKDTYQIDQINTYIKQAIEENGGDPDLFDLTVFSTRTQLTLGTETGGNRYGIDFSQATSGNFYVLTGFDPNFGGSGIYLSPATPDSTIVYTSQEPANITLGITSFQLIFPGLVTGGIGLPPDSIGGTPVPSLYSDGFKVPPGYNQTEIIPNPLWARVAPTNTNAIECRITDQNGNVLDFNQGGSLYNNSSSVRLQFKKL